MLYIGLNSKDKCKICLFNDELDERGVCSDCLVIVPDGLINVIDSYGKSYTVTECDRHLIFTYDNWSEHWSVVARRMELRTECRKIHIDGKAREIEAISAAGRYITCKDYVCAYGNIWKSWYFVDVKSCGGCKKNCDSKYPHKCPHCGEPAFIGAVNVDCSKCSGR